LSIQIEYPVWFVVLCLLLGAAIALLLYFRNRKDELPRRLMLFLAVLRFLAVSLISFLLLSPLIRSINRTYEKPVIIVAIDNSQSVRMVKDSAYYLSEFRQDLGQLITALNREYDTRIYSMGDKMQLIDDQSLSSLSFRDKQTDLSAVFQEVESSYSNRNIGAILLASDGIYNRGLNPLYSSRDIAAPVYTIALGDTNLQRDILLQRINYNRIAYLGNQFPVEITAGAHKFAGQRSRLTVSRGDSILFAKNIDFASDLYSERFIAELKASKTGLVRYRVSLTGLADEISYENNASDIFIEVLDSRQKILILYSSPHPDLSAIKSAIQTNYNYEVEDHPVNDFQGELSGFNLVVLHQVPARAQNQAMIISKIKDSKVPVLCIIGEQTDLQALNQLNLGLVIRQNERMVNEAIPVVNKDFILFRSDEETRSLLEKFPPLVSPFGNYDLPPTANVLAYQKIGKVISDMPLIFFTEMADSKAGFIAGEGIWRWRLFNYMERENHIVFNQLINKIIQYLAVREEKGFFRVMARSVYHENETIELEAEVYTKSYEPTSEPDVEIVIENEEGTRFPYTFGRKGNAYHLQVGNYPPGNYSYRAKVKVGNDLYEKTGQFSVEAVNIESVATRADHPLLYNLAKRHGGEMIFPEQIAQLPALLKERDDIHTLIYSRKAYNELNNVIWVLVAIIALLATEWFIRKYKGSY